MITNLGCSRLQFRSDADPDVAPYVHRKEVEVQQVPLSQDMQLCREGLLKAMRAVVQLLTTNKVGGWGKGGA